MRTLKPSAAILLCMLSLALLAAPKVSIAQEAAGSFANSAMSAAPDADVLEVPQQVDVEPVRDEDIASRLQGVLGSTGRFEGLSVRVDNGVVFIDGLTLLPEHREWARQVALRTTDVVAVVNNLRVVERSIWDFSASFAIVGGLWRGFIQLLPVFGFSLGVLLFTGMIAWAIARVLDKLLSNRIRPQLLRRVVANVAGGIVLILGIYVILRVANLTTLAATLLGGTGLIGLILGIGFRDISENFLASLLLSIQQPFRTGDMVRIKDNVGIVQRLTTRGTLLMGLDGNYIQIPNSIVYKNVIVNLTANPKVRLDFLIGIGYDTHISRAQEVAMRTLTEHPAVLKDPEAMVLVDNLSASTIDLRIYFWIDGTKHSIQKSESAVMRLVVRACIEEGISMPDSAREVIFPQGVPLVRAGQGNPLEAIVEKHVSDTKASATNAEGALKSEVAELQVQVNQSRLPEQGRNILDQGH